MAFYNPLLRVAPNPLLSQARPEMSGYSMTGQKKTTKLPWEDQFLQPPPAGTAETPLPPPVEEPSPVPEETMPGGDQNELLSPEAERYYTNMYRYAQRQKELGIGPYARKPPPVPISLFGRVSPWYQAHSMGGSPWARHNYLLKTGQLTVARPDRPV